MALPALPTHLTLELVTPDHAVAHEMVDEVELPGVKGYFGVLPGHTPLLAVLGVGELWYRRGQEKTYVAVHRGVAEVLPDRVTVLCQNAERADEIDVTRAEAAKRRAEAELKTPQVKPEDFERIRIALMKSLARLQVASKTRMRG
jgi:F-type H+-transporting ATPase subunit epsilon